MNGQPIPGFYFDPDKQKYFRIQSHVAARDLNLKYSTQHLRQEEQKKQLQKTAKARSNQVQRERVVRLGANDFAHTVIGREIGTRRKSFYTQVSWSNAIISGFTSQPKQFLDSEQGAAVRYFDQDPSSKTIYAVHRENQIKRRRRYRKDGPPSSKLQPDGNECSDATSLDTCSFEPWDELARTTSTISSLCYLPASGALAATTYGSDRSPVIYLTDPDRDGPYVGQLFTPKGCATIWGAAARPTSFLPSQPLANSVSATQTEHLAVGASRSMLLFTRSPTGMWNSKSAMGPLDSDILALDWMSYNTVAFGCRDGNVYFYDTRSGGSSRVLRHPYPISKLKRADDDTRMICSGLQDSLFLYDIRFSRQSHPSFSSSNHDNPPNIQQYPNIPHVGHRASKKRRKMNQMASKQCSQPIICFSHQNSDDLELDVDVHPNLGLLVASQDPATGISMRISNMWTGRTVKEIKSNPVKPSRGQEQLEKTRCVKFMHQDEQAGDVDLWTCWNSGIARFGW